MMISSLALDWTTTVIGRARIIFTIRSVSPCT
ncbi:hypothetical protein L917_07265 [Phytophthora nicotianae]|uniref:Uncharacterized protein n=1 Tax=Phytophthora nicotianae TaxID=4792 RepID=W2LDW3_PHYNI|nr:hypothetical protein L917_07265 [Phytophthora nicotianae]